MTSRDNTSASAELDSALVDRLLAAEASDDDRTAFMAWARRSPSEARFSGLVNAAARREDQPLSVDPDRAWSAMRARMNQSPSGSATARGAMRVPSNRWPMYGAVAAIACVVVGIGAEILRHTTPHTDASASVERYATRPGQRASVTLADGSRVTLGPDSRVEVSSSRTGRVARVDGQALFVVSHHTDAPFSVRTTGSIARVLGTTFFVRQYERERAARIGVVDGRVAIRPVHGSANTQGTVLTANTLGVVTDSGVTVRPNVAMNDYTAWTSGTLAFHETPVRELVAELSRAYGVDVRVTDSTLAAQRISWRVSTERDPLPSMLPELLTMLNAHATQSGSIITILPGKRDVRARRTPNNLPTSSETHYGR